MFEEQPSEAEKRHGIIQKCHSSLVSLFSQISQVHTFSSSFNLILIPAHLCLDLPSGLFFRTSTKSPSKYVYFVPSPSYLLKVIIYRRFWPVQKPGQCHSVNILNWLTTSSRNVGVVIAICRKVRFQLPLV